VLEAEGYGVDWATNGPDALRKAREAKPDLVILDVMMNSDDEGFQVTYKNEADAELSVYRSSWSTSVGRRTGFSFEPVAGRGFPAGKRVSRKPVTRGFSSIRCAKTSGADAAPTPKDGLARSCEPVPGTASRSASHSRDELG